MKCSKCGYLGFDSGERCRNCGYEFSLAESFEPPDLAIHREGDAAHQLFSALDPLDDTPLITKPSSPRPPLAVRRSTPDVARIRASTRTAAEPALDFQPALKDETPVPAKPLSTRITPTSIEHQDASLTRRAIAAAIDLVILIAVDLLVVYFTIQICGVSMSELALLPKGPLATFLLVQDIGYLIAFTAGGQTLGKMAAGIKVVAGDCDGCVDIPCALKRTLLSLLLAAPAGLGLLPAVFDRRHRGLHDRLAGTRVVRATA